MYFSDDPADDEPLDPAVYAYAAADRVFREHGGQAFDQAEQAAYQVARQYMPDAEARELAGQAARGERDEGEL